MSDLFDVADVALGAARDGEQVEAYVARSRDTTVRVYDGEVEQLSTADSLGVGVRLVDGSRQGFAYCGTFDADAVREAVSEARDNAQFAEPDEWAGLAEPDSAVPTELDLWRAELLDVPVERKVAVAVELEHAMRAADPRITGIESADYNDVAGELAVATTTGIRRAARNTVCQIVGYPLATDGEETQSGFGFSVGRSLDDIDIEQAARDGADRATRLLGAIKPPSERLTVVLDPWVTSQVVSIVASTLSAEEVLKGRSLFSDRVGEQVAAPELTIVEDPTEPRTWGATPIDDEGLATRPVPLIEGGVLRGFVHSTWTARRSGAASTASAVRAGFKATPHASCRAVTLAPGSTPPDELIGGIDEGVLVQHVSGLHSGVNPVSGDLSTGAQGLRIRGGAVAEPLREFTIASTLQRLLLDVSAVGDDLTWLPMNAAGLTLVISDVAISGT
jgi:PmbA protein